MSGIAPAGARVSRLVIVKGGYDVEGVKAPVLRVANVYYLPAQISRKL